MSQSGRTPSFLPSAFLRLRFAIEVSVNGTERDLDDDVSVAQLLVSLGLGEQRVAASRVSATRLGYLNDVRGRAGRKMA